MDPEKLKNKSQEMEHNPYPQTPEGFLGQLHALETFNLQQELPNITTPFLLIAGEQDLSTPIHCAQELELHLPHATLLHSFPNVGHMSHIERRQDVASLIHTFFI